VQATLQVAKTALVTVARNQLRARMPGNLGFFMLPLELAVGLRRYPADA
jgi:hypothetical protein